LVVLGLLLPQRPAEALADPTVNSLWLTSLRERYHSAADWLVRLGLTEIYRSLWFRGLLGLLALSLLVGALELIYPRHLPAGAHSSIALRGESGSETLEQISHRLAQLLREQRYRLVEGGSEGVLHADRFVPYPILAYVGALLVLGGLVVSERRAWWEAGFVLRPEQVRPLGHGTSLAVRAEPLEQTNNGIVHSAASTALTFFEADLAVGQVVLRARLPSLYAGILFFPASMDPALLVQAQDTTGRNLGLQTPQTGATEFRQLALHFRKEESSWQVEALGPTPTDPVEPPLEHRGNERYALVPSRNLTLRLSYSSPGPGETRLSFRVEAFRSEEASPFYDQQFQGPSSMEIDGDLYMFHPQHYTVLRFGQDVGLAVGLLGVPVVLLGFVLSLVRPMRRMSLVTQTRDEELTLNLTASGALRQGTLGWFEDTVATVSASLGLNLQDES
jgi:hypothetical protein